MLNFAYALKPIGIMMIIYDAAEYNKINNKMNPDFKNSIVLNFKKRGFNCKIYERPEPLFLNIREKLGNRISSLHYVPKELFSDSRYAIMIKRN
ncbi:MAG: hypothetical protein V1824_03865 [archaeon]